MQPNISYSRNIVCLTQYPQYFTTATTSTNTETTTKAQITNRYQINTVIAQCFPKALTALQPPHPLPQPISQLINQQLATTTN